MAYLSTSGLGAPVLPNCPYPAGRRQHTVPNPLLIRRYQQNWAQWQGPINERLYCLRLWEQEQWPPLNWTLTTLQRQQDPSTWSRAGSAVISWRLFLRYNVIKGTIITMTIVLILALILLPLIPLWNITESRRTKIQRARSNGHKWRSTATRYGVSERTVRRWATAWLPLSTTAGLTTKLGTQP